MRTTIAIATFLAVGAGAVGVSALNLKGSDTIKDTTVALLTEATPDCGGVSQGGTLIYDGTGSGNGQAAMLDPNSGQFVAPMSRPFNNGICGPSQATAEGIAFELDGITIAANGANWNTCNGANRPDCTPDPANPQGGVVFTRTLTPDASRTCVTAADCNTAGISGEICGSGGVCQYTLTSWKDALKFIYFGMSAAAGTNFANRNCGSPERTFLANNWNQFLQTCSSTNCPAGIQHAFRRNDESGTSDLFATLLFGSSPINQINNTSPFCNVGTSGPTYFAASPPSKACNADTDCVASSPPAGICATDTTSPTGKRCQVVLKGAQAAVSSFDTTLPAPAGGRPNLSPTNITECLTGANAYKGEYFTDLQDHDFIRRACAFPSEDVCSARGDLGLVLPIWDVPNTDIPSADAFPTLACANGTYTCESASRDNCSGAAHFALCPDGTDPNAPSGTNLCPKNQCAYPAGKTSAGLDPRCNAPRTANPPGAGTFDGRVYNLTTWTSDPSAGFIKAKITRSTGLTNPPTGAGTTAGVAMVGAFYRIHSVHSIASPAILCKKVSATDQIGCLVQASPCSIGYAGNSAADGTNTIALKVNNVDPNNLCVQNFLSDPTFANATTYPLSRKLFLNTIAGFETVTGDQLKLASCFASGTASNIANGLGFVPLPPGQETFCEDFNEQTTCGASSNNNACSNNSAPIPSCRFGDTSGCSFGTGP